MASIRNFKKDVYFLTQELASECLVKMLLHPEIKEESIDALAIEGVELSVELVKRAANRDAKNNPKLVKQYFKKLNKDMMEGYNSLFEKLAAIK